MQWIFDGPGESCPYCGCTKANLYLVGDWKELYLFKCSDCGKSPVPESAAASSLHGAIMEWNYHAVKLNTRKRMRR